MGAVAAFLAGTSRPLEPVVTAMCTAAPHRGSKVDTLALGRCALGITGGTDPDDASIAQVDGVIAAFAGALDNAADLARELEARGARPQSSSPAALVAAGHRVFGESLPARLRGIYTAAVGDGERLHCFRDHLGYGLLFHRSDGGDFLAATEAKQVVAGAGLRREPDVDVAEQILWGTVDDETPSALRGVRRLQKSHLIAASAGGTHVHRYWDPEPLLEAERLSDDELAERFHALMEQAAARCVTGQDVISLSGGIDSPAILAYAAPRHLEVAGRPLQAASVVYPKYPSVDERRYVELLAERFAIPLHTFEQEANAIADLDKWVALADGPYPAASLAQYAEDYGVARGLGGRTVLTGEHAEFVFALDWHLLEHLLTHGRVDALRRHIRNRIDRGRSPGRIGRELAAAVSPGGLIAMRRRRGSLGVPDWVEVPRARASAAADVASPRQRWRRLQLRAFRGPGISAEAEAICQAACGVRTRRPWTDIDLFEFFLKLPAEQKFPDAGSKSLVRRLLRGRVPDEILDRRDKTVFDEAALAQIDYATLRRFLIDPPHRFPGIDYDVLADRLRAERLPLADYAWARRLVVVHAFLAQW